MDYHFSDRGSIVDPYWQETNSAGEILAGFIRLNNYQIQINRNMTKNSTTKRNKQLTIMQLTVNEIEQIKINHKAKTNIFMIQMAKKLNLPKGSLRIHVIIKSIGYLLNRNHLIRVRVQY